MHGRLRWVLVGGTLCVLGGCAEASRAVQDSTTPQRSSPTLMRAPETDRCKRLPPNETKRICEGSLKVAEAWARRLAPGDPICLDNGVGDDASADCHSRGTVMDTATDRVLVEIRWAKPDSKWFRRVETQIWFDEGALVDLYLAERGY